MVKALGGDLRSDLQELGQRQQTSADCPPADCEDQRDDERGNHQGPGEQCIKQRFIGRLVHGHVDTDFGSVAQTHGARSCQQGAVLGVAPLMLLRLCGWLELVHLHVHLLRADREKRRFTLRRLEDADVQVVVAHHQIHKLMCVCVDA
ncbi:hypothetical protein D3C81_1511210 [compost metagenome]